MTSITRRAALRGAGAAVAVAGVPTAVAAKPIAAEVEFFHAKMTEALNEEMRLDEAFGVALKAFRKIHPKPGVWVEKLRSGERVWCEQETDTDHVVLDNHRLKQCSPKYWPKEYDRLYWAAHRNVRNEELRSKYLQARAEHNHRVDVDTLRDLDAAKIELQASKKKDDCLQEAAGLGALGRRIEAENDRYFKFQRLFLDSQAETPRALLLRVQEMDDDVEDGTYGRKIYDALLRDLGRLAGEARP